jgi:hypothetical protein
VAYIKLYNGGGIRYLLLIWNMKRLFLYCLGRKVYVFMISTWFWQMRNDTFRKYVKIFTWRAYFSFWSFQNGLFFFTPQGDDSSRISLLTLFELHCTYKLFIDRTAFRGKGTGYNCPERQFFGGTKMLWWEICSLGNYWHSKIILKLLFFFCF